MVLIGGVALSDRGQPPQCPPTDDFADRSRATGAPACGHGPAGGPGISDRDRGWPGGIAGGNRRSPAVSPGVPSLGRSSPRGAQSRYRGRDRFGHQAGGSPRCSRFDRRAGSSADHHALQPGGYKPGRAARADAFACARGRGLPSQLRRLSRRIGPGRRTGRGAVWIPSRPICPSAPNCWTSRRSTITAGSLSVWWARRCRHSSNSCRPRTGGPRRLYATLLRLPSPSGEVPPALHSFPVTGQMSDAELLGALPTKDTSAAALARVAAIRSAQPDATANATAQVFDQVRRPARVNLRARAEGRLVAPIPARSTPT